MSLRTNYFGALESGMSVLHRTQETGASAVHRTQEAGIRVGYGVVELAMKAGFNIAGVVVEHPKVSGAVALIGSALTYKYIV